MATEPTARLSQTYIAALRHQKSEEVCSTPSSLQVADVAFYERLYTPQRIYLSSAKELLRTIPLALRIITAQGDQLTRPLTLVDIQEVAKRCPSNSSPGLDGISYQILTIVFLNAAARGLAIQRSIDLINTEAKGFTRLISARPLPYMNRLVSPYQLGFMPGRFIGENSKLDDLKRHGVPSAS
ncbi:uncharacterized protein RHIMIDRAFT_242539 [Rhizopus microsporus ATCC 52813]|uniref:Reverse transcriptase domain-containing protein n=1 Tax=Rhizopus microsporus ATCC 52813 TaxID=1340429 RepID=A0A2G4SFM0_RHIZD|nr:uncharacterized protein RHIMIDRAFT_242539 [Rhizopus microsporus ATCC 52813]PHZ07564.1 hypothetical protein RHIMIDRAFT_242539 [Rhizopus microsporus ATCC 52813]